LQVAQIALTRGPLVIEQGRLPGSKFASPALALPFDHRFLLPPVLAVGASGRRGCHGGSFWVRAAKIVRSRNQLSGYYLSRKTYGQNATLRVCFRVLAAPRQAAPPAQAEA
jgi:hypothetical protein